MGTLSRLTISEWHEISATPQKFIDQFNANVSRLSPTERRSVIASMPVETEMLQIIESALQKEAPPMGYFPFLVKDLFDVAGKATRAGSVFLERVRQTPKQSSPLVEGVIDCGGIYAGKTHLNEFAYGTSGQNPHYGDCQHPFVKGALTGGSSSGSAFAVARGLVPFALGTDTSGSIRIPAAFCGLFGFRTVPHLWTDRGCIELSASYDTGGWMTHYLEDMIRVQTLLAPDAVDKKGLRGLYLPLMDFPSEVAVRYRSWADALEAERDPEMETWLAKQFKGSTRAYATLSSREAFLVHQDWLDAMHEHYDPVVWSRIHRGRQWTEDDLSIARDRQQQVRHAWTEIFKIFDYVLMPAVPSVAPQEKDITDEYRRYLLDLNTPASVGGLPALTLPVPVPGGNSAGLQVVFPSMQELHVRQILERAKPFYN